eukprot:GILJ01005940.1.p1 GENE.GILJ01005940.1~~GILJ01005940.1.p1  ORF type:complete len:335 (-),score=24.14 GILJ01005940.1:30-1034(-)
MTVRHYLNSYNMASDGGVMTKTYAEAVGRHGVGVGVNTVRQLMVSSTTTATATQAVSCCCSSVHVNSLCINCNFQPDDDFIATFARACAVSEDGASQVEKRSSCTTVVYDADLGETLTVSQEQIMSNPFLFIKYLPPPPQELLLRKPCLPAIVAPHRCTLVLDLDETLVHCSETAMGEADFIVPVASDDGCVSYVYMRTRPFVYAFLAAVSHWFEVVVFTASLPHYANAVLDTLDPRRQFITHRVFRDSCIEVNGIHVKDLRILGRPLESTLLVDNSFFSFAYQLENGLPVKTWIEDPDDTELLMLIPFLKAIATSEDVRPVLREVFQLFKLLE